LASEMILKNGSEKGSWQGRKIHEPKNPRAKQSPNN